MKDEKKQEFETLGFAAYSKISTDIAEVKEAIRQFHKDFQDTTARQSLALVDIITRLDRLERETATCPFNK